MGANSISFSYGGLTVGGLPALVFGVALTAFVAFAIWSLLRRVGFSRRRAALRLIFLLIPIVQLGVLAELAWGQWPSEQLTERGSHPEQTTAGVG